jgi:perosamine synthetase
MTGEPTPDGGRALTDARRPQDVIPVAEPVLGDREVEYVLDAVRSGWVSSAGPYLERFETSFSRYVGTPHAIAVANGTVALHLILHALNIRAGDEVIVPDLTFAATAHAVLQAGATPVFVDIEPTSWCMDLGAARRAVSERTKAIIPVHLYGQPADTGALGALAEEIGVPLIEDAAEALGGRVRKAMVGTLGRAAAFSFYGNKIVTTGEGGMITTSDAELAARLRFLKDHAMSKSRRYLHTELGFNYRMTNLQAALGVAQMEHVEALVAAKRQIREWYGEELAGVEGTVLNTEVPGTRNVFWMTSIVVPDEVPNQRDLLGDRMRAQGVETRPFFVPLSQLPHLAGYRQVGVSADRCDVARSLALRGLNLPSGGRLSREDIAFVASVLKESL